VISVENRKIFSPSVYCVPPLTGFLWIGIGARSQKL